MLLLDATLKRLHEALIEPSARPDGVREGAVDGATYARWVETTLQLLERALTRQSATG